MKNLRTTVLCTIVALCTLSTAARAQKTDVHEPDYNKPRLFTRLPDVIPVTVDKLNDFLSARKNEIVSTTLSSDAKTASFEGKVIASANENGAYQRVAIQSTNYNGATLSVSKRALPDGTIVYAARILSFQHGDAYVLEKQAGGYAWIKKNFTDIINE